MRSEVEIKKKLEEIDIENQTLEEQGYSINYTERRDFLDTKFNALEWVLGVSNEIAIP